MPINFPANPTDGQELIVGNGKLIFNSTKGIWKHYSTEAAAQSSGDTGGATVYADMAALIAATGMSNGDQAFVTANNNLYIYSGTGWYKVATVQNDSPTAITGVSGSYSLAIDGTPTVITAVSTDPEGFPLTWTYSTSGLGSIATVSQADNVFTITPSTTEANAGTFSLTINATDGVNGAVSTTTNLTLELIVIVTNSRYTTLLATATGTGDNNNITDSSSNNHTINVIGDVNAGTFSPYRHDGYSTYFDGQSDFLQNSDGTGAGEVGSGAFCIEAWIYKESNGAFDCVCSLGTGVGSYQFEAGNGSNLVQWEDNNGTVVSSTTTLNLNQWYHVAVSRDNSNNIRLYVNGTKEDQAVRAEDYNDAGPFEIARNRGATQEYHGYIRDLRIVVGDPVYTADTIAVPNRPLTVITNTNLLTCHLPYIADGSSNRYSLTVYGSTLTKPFSPYDNSEYLATNHGGSVYFDGSDYCTISDSEDFEFGSGDFTVECWVHMTAYEGTGFQMFLHKGGNNSNAWHFDYKNSTTELRFLPYVSNVNTTITATTTLNLNQWYHVAAVRNGNTIVLYKNGKAVSSTAYSLTIDNTADAIHIGQRAHLNDRRLTGYLSDIRINKSAVYTSDFTVPTSPVSSTGSTLHIKGTDASIIDKSQTNNLKLFGNTTGSTAQAKFADSKSIYFDSTSASDNVQLKHNGLLSLSGPFTIEFWCNMNAGGSVNYTSFFYWDGTNYAARLTDSGFGNRLQVCFDAGVSTGIYAVNATRTYLAGLGWFHFAWTRDNNNDNRIFINGSIVNVTGGSNWSSYPSPSSFPLSSFNDNRTLGSSADFVFATGDGGYIEDFRITNGLARYTANFTPPTEPLKG